MNPLLDLSTLNTVAACNQGAEIELRHPTSNAPLGIFVTVLGKDSDVFKSYVRQATNARLRKAAAEKRRARETEVLTVEENEQQGVELLATCTVSWRTANEPSILFNAELLACTHANAVRLYGQLPWIREQIDTAIGDLENFLKT